MKPLKAVRKAIEIAGGVGRGFKARAAKRLDISPAHLSLIYTGRNDPPMHIAKQLAFITDEAARTLGDSSLFVSVHEMLPKDFELAERGILYPR